ncbi:13862_t:CDS:2, partial [Gigaspora margarita]
MADDALNATTEAMIALAHAIGRGSEKPLLNNNAQEWLVSLEVEPTHFYDINYRNS